jgi:hypothetical protein
MQHPSTETVGAVVTLTASLIVASEDHGALRREPPAADERDAVHADEAREHAERTDDERFRAEAHVEERCDDASDDRGEDGEEPLRLVAAQIPPLRRKRRAGDVSRGRRAERRR